MKQTILKKEVNDRFRNDDEIVLEISKAMGKSYGRVKNWFYEDNMMLTSYAALSVMSNASGKKIEELITVKNIKATI